MPKADNKKRSRDTIAAIAAKFDNGPGSINNRRMKHIDRLQDLILDEWCPLQTPAALWEQEFAKVTAYLCATNRLPLCIDALYDTKYLYQMALWMRAQDGAAANLGDAFPNATIAAKWATFKAEHADKFAARDAAETQWTKLDNARKHCWDMAVKSPDLSDAEFLAQYGITL